MRHTDLGGCERWGGSHRKHDGRPIAGKQYAYRVLWENQHRPLSPSEVLHHLCGNAWCINLQHLELTTQGKHVRTHRPEVERYRKAKTHCTHGHPFDEHNTYYVTTRSGRTERQCRQCSAERKRSARALAGAKPRIKRRRLP